MLVGRKISSPQLKFTQGNGLCENLGIPQLRFRLSVVSSADLLVPLRQVVRVLFGAATNLETKTLTRDRFLPTTTRFGEHLKSASQHFYPIKPPIHVEQLNSHSSWPLSR